jgi:hypothetical protein
MNEIFIYLPMPLHPESWISLGGRLAEIATLLGQSVAVKWDQLMESSTALVTLSFHTPVASFPSTVLDWVEANQGTLLYQKRIS